MGHSDLHPEDVTVPPGAGSSSGNRVHSEAMHHFYSNLDKNVVRLVTVLICLLGLVGNGTVIWLLGFRMKRNPFSVYILNLACADFTFLLGISILSLYNLLPWCVGRYNVFFYSVNTSPFLVGLCLLMAVSTERCVSVICPIWYRCHRPEHLSSILCALIWVLGSCLAIWVILCNFPLGIICINVQSVTNVVAFVTFLVLCVSSLTLLIRVQCCSRRRRLSRLYLTLLLNALTFLLLGLPYGVWHYVYWFSASQPRTDIPFSVTRLLLVLNSVVNPIIYFFVGRKGQPQGSKQLRAVLQSALADEEEGAEQRRGVAIPVSSQDNLFP